MGIDDINGAVRGRHTDVRVKRSRSVARTTLDAAATPQTSQMVAGEVLQPCHVANGRARGEPLAFKEKSAPQALRLDNSWLEKLSLCC